MPNLSACLLWGCVHLLIQRASRELYDEILPSMECMALDWETININNCRRKKQDLSVLRCSRNSSPEGRGGLHRAGEWDLGPQEGSEKQIKMAEDAAVVLSEMTEAAGGRLRSLCMAVGSWDPPTAVKQVSEGLCLCPPSTKAKP